MARSPHVQQPAINPWYAVNLSLFLPGLGQVRAGRVGAGLVWMLATVGSLGYGFSRFYLPDGRTFVGALFLVLSGVLYVLAAIFAHRAGKGTQRDDTAAPAGASPARARDAWLAFFLSRLVPGVGQFYAGRRLAGTGLLVAWVAAAVIPGGPEPLKVALAVFQALLGGGAAYLAYAAARAEAPRPPRAVAVMAVLLFALPVVALGAAAVFRASVVQAFRIPSDSMAPTLVKGDNVFVSRLPGQAVHLGDVVAFRYPEDPRQLMLKRCVGVPGDTVALVDKRYYRNAIRRIEPYIQNVDTLTIPRGLEPRDNFGPYVVPAGSYFLLGDNRDDSHDSRYFGAVKRADILGVAYKVYFPLEHAGRLGLTERPGRFRAGSP